MKTETMKSSKVLRTLFFRLLPVQVLIIATGSINAIVDGASSVMLTGETAVGEHPVDSVRFLAETVRAAHRYAGEQ